MKRIWFGVALLVGLLLLGIGSSALMKQTQFAQADRLTQAAALASDGDWAAARELLAQANQKWHRQQRLIAALCRHEPMDQIEGIFAQLEVFAAARSVVSFSSTCVLLARQLQILGQSHALTLENFL